MKLNDTKNNDNETESDQFGGATSESDIEETETTNHEGGQAFKQRSPQRKLYKRTANNLLENTFYEDAEDLKTGLVNAFNEVADADPEFVLNLAAYARQEMGLRDVPQLLLALAARDSRFNTYPPESGHQNDTRIRDYTPAVVRRMDEAATVVSIYLNVFEVNSLPNGLKKGLSDAINMMSDEYTLSKYQMENRQVTLYDVFNRIHPEPTDRVENWHGLSIEERGELFDRLMKGELDDYPTVEPLVAPDTWEVKISEEGNNLGAWREVVDDMGIMAKIRNVRNMLEAGLDGDEIFDESDMEAAKHSKMFPFRFYQAYKAYNDPHVPNDTTVENFLSDAIEETAGNIPDEFENTLVVADTSGSMNQPVSGGSNLNCYEISTFFASVASTIGADVGAFASSFEETSFHNQTPALDRIETVADLPVGGATNGHLVFDQLNEENREYDNVVLLTDEQLWNSRYRNNRSLKDAVDDYREEVTESCSLYVIDLQAYGDMSMPDGYENVYNVSGWSEDILNFVSYAEKEQEILHEVSNYDPHPVF